MSSDLAISVQGLSKQYTVHDTGAWSLKSAILHLPAYLRQQRQQTSFWAVQDVTFDVAQGEFFSIIGANGSGKSTLLRMLAGLSKPSAGTIATSGNVSSLLELGSGFHPSVSGRENAVMNGLLMGLSRAEIDEVMPRIVEFSGLAEFIDQPMRTYSSGMYLRLGFAIATALEPDVLVVDEVLAVGDSQFQDKCYAHIESVMARGATVVMVSHDLNAVERLSSRVALMEQGNLVALGNPHDTVAEHLERLISSSPEIRRNFDEALTEKIAADPAARAELEAKIAEKRAAEEREA